MLVALLVASLALQLWTWRRLRRRVLSGAITKLGAVVGYAQWMLAPVALCLFAFFAAIAQAGSPSTGAYADEIVRASLPAAEVLLGLGILGWVCFSIFCVFVWRRPGAS